MLDELGEVDGVDIAVRVNSVASGLLDEDLKVVMAAQHRPQTILLPKADTVDDLVLVGFVLLIFYVCVCVCVCVCVRVCAGTGWQNLISCAKLCVSVWM